MSAIFVDIHWIFTHSLKLETDTNRLVTSNEELETARRKLQSQKEKLTNERDAATSQADSTVQVNSIIPRSINQDLHRVLGARQMQNIMREASEDD